MSNRFGFIDNLDEEEFFHKVASTKAKVFVEELEKSGYKVILHDSDSSVDPSIEIQGFKNKYDIQVLSYCTDNLVLSIYSGHGGDFYSKMLFSGSFVDLMEFLTKNPLT